MYRELNAEKVAATADRLQRRIQERFPEAGLAKVSAELLEITQMAQSRSRSLRRPIWPLRIGTWFLIAVGLALLVFVFSQIRVTEGFWKIDHFVEIFNAGLGTLVFLGAAVLFLVTSETRYKRKRALRAIHELRSMAHVVDMHQLVKDPELVVKSSPTASSPVRNMSPKDLNRYLDYCSEMLAIISKVSALYVQGFMDPVVLSAVDEVETLATGLSRKVWQKIMLLERYDLTT